MPDSGAISGRGKEKGERDEMNDLATFQAGDREIQLGFDFNNLCDAEPVVGCNLLSAMESMGGPLTATQLRGLLYAMVVPFDGFKDKSPRDQLQAVGGLVLMTNTEAIRVAMVAAMAEKVSPEHLAAFRARILGEESADSETTPAPIPDPMIVE